MKHFWIFILLTLALLVAGWALTKEPNCLHEGNGWVGGTSIQNSVYLVPVSPVFYQAPLSRDLFRIVACENINWNISARNPNSTAYGLCQIIDGTWGYVENKWNMSLDRDDPNDQLYACQRLLNEESFYPHWEAIRKCLEAQ